MAFSSPCESQVEKFLEQRQGRPGALHVYEKHPFPSDVDRGIFAVISKFTNSVSLPIVARPDMLAPGVVNNKRIVLGLRSASGCKAFNSF